MSTNKYVILKESNLEGGAGSPMRFDVAEITPKEAADIARDPAVSAIAPKMPVALIKPFAAAQPAASKVAWGIEAVAATRSRYDGAGVRVAVLDTGIDASHPAFNGVDIQQVDFVGEGDGDKNGHGTHCAGTILGRDIDGTRIGVARGVTDLLVGKVLGAEGGGGTDALFNAIQWAVMSRASVISMSLGFDFPGMVSELAKQNWPIDLATSRALEAYRANLRMFDALMGMINAQQAFNPGVVVVAAAGNESHREVNVDYEIAASLPAAGAGVISVGAAEPIDKGFGIASFSNSLPEVCAPGVGVLSAAANTKGLVAFNGTSMACPHVAGVAALWWQAAAQPPGPMNATTVTAKLRATARKNQFVKGLNPGQYGAGLVTAPLE